jgi:putative transposase
MWPTPGSVRKKVPAPKGRQKGKHIMSFICFHCHIVFATKNRLPTITPDIRARLYSYIGGIFKAEDCTLISAGGVSDHVHLLSALNAQKSISDIIRDVKAGSLKWVHQTFPGAGNFSWQDGYSLFAVSYSNLEKVQRYIEGQEEHHKKVSFVEELIAFLKKNNVPYDEKYL